jgi:lysophospholipid acyltransferase (LPLAT)-like uncharacterized protein
MSADPWAEGGRDLDERALAAIRRQGFWLARLLKAWGRTWRIRGLEDSEYIRRESPNKSIVYVFWHNRMLMLAYTHRHRRIQVLRSGSRDGRLIADVLLRFGYEAPAGSSSQGGAAGLRRLVQGARRGLDAALTVDGPRGPRGHLKPGALQVAALSGNPLVPVAVGAPRCLQFNSWDRTLLPLPFSRLQIRYGAPRWAPRGADPDALETLRAALEADLRQLTDALDRDLGRRPIPPASTGSL